MVEAVDKNNGAKASSPKNISYSKKETRQHVLLSFPCEIKKAAALLEKWINDNAICLPEVELLHSVADQKVRGTACTIKKKKKYHTLEQYFTYGSIFDEKHKTREILFPGAINISNL